MSTLHFTLLVPHSHLFKLILGEFQTGLQPLYISNNAIQSFVSSIYDRLKFS